MNNKPTHEEWRDAYLEAVGFSGDLDEVATILAEKKAADRLSKEKRRGEKKKDVRRGALRHGDHGPDRE